MKQLPIARRTSDQRTDTSIKETGNKFAVSPSRPSIADLQAKAEREWPHDDPEYIAWKRKRA